MLNGVGMSREFYSPSPLCGPPVIVTKQPNAKGQSSSELSKLMALTVGIPGNLPHLIAFLEKLLRPTERYCFV